MNFSVQDIGLHFDTIIDSNAIVSEWVIDTRRISFPNQSIFVALKGDLRDGHSFVDDAYRKGIRYFLLEREMQLPDDALSIIVNDTLDALQILAKAARKKYQGQVIAVTGSNGKTVTKDWLAFLLRDTYKLYKSPKSYNSQIGVAISILEMDEDTDIAILEAGISDRGEMSKLEDMIQPDFGIMTLIGDAHQEGFLSVEEKLNEKLSLFVHCKKIVSVAPDSSTLKEAILSFSKSNTIPLDFVYKKEWQITIQNHETQLVKNNEKFIIPFVDEASIANSIMCIESIRFFDLKIFHLKENLKELPVVNMRLEFIDGTQETKIINDAYNADLHSVKIALATLNNQSNKLEKTVILSELDVPEDAEEKSCVQMLKLLNHYHFNRVILIGKNWLKYSSYYVLDESTSLNIFPTTDSLIEQLATLDFSHEFILVKGARKFALENIVKELKEKQHTVKLIVNLNHLKNNFDYYKSCIKPGTKVMVMVKAFSYGAGSYEIAQQLQNWGVDYLGVAYADEGVTLRRKGITVPIMVMNPEKDSFSDMYKWGLEPEVYNHRLLDALIEFLHKKNNPQFAIHIKLDTGMHRLGWHECDIESLSEKLNHHPNLEVKSVFTHLATADAEDERFVHQQVQTFNSMVQNFVNNGIENTGMKHVLNSAGIEKYSQYQFDMIRLGIGLYGVSSNASTQKLLKIVSTLKAEVSQVNMLDVGDTVGYSQKGIVSKPSQIATINIGYADGYPRELSNGKGKILYNGNLYPIIGNVCMDMCMVDMTGAIGLREGDEVTVFGESPTIQELALWANTIPYEILTSVSSRVFRVYNWD